MDFEKHLKMLKREWERFIKEDTYDESVVRTEIAESWKRCKSAGVDPYGGVCRKVLKGKELDELLEDNRELIDIARPILRSLYMFLKGSGYYVMLANEEVYLLEFFGDPTMEKEAEGMNFMRGACWKEEYVGTTVLGIIPYYRAPIQMAGAEHYCTRSQGFTCASAPIFNEKKELLGLVSISGPVADMHKHTLGLVVAAVEAIQNSMAVTQKNRMLQDMNRHFINIFKSVSEAIIVYDKEERIQFQNDAAKKMIGGDPENGMPLEKVIDSIGETDVFHEREFQDEEAILLTANGEKGCIVSGMPMADESGTVVVIRPIEKVHKLVRRYGNTQARIHVEDIIGNSREIRTAVDMARTAAETDSNILLQGESGTGKEIFAQSIHNLSDRRDGPFIAVNCGAIPRELVGSELFGYSEGAFTGAARGGRPGKFEIASKGTIFLDEIGDMPLEQQVNLLRVLQEHRVLRIGGSEEIPVDVRVIAASNKSLSEEMKSGNFRADLFYRINVISIDIPPLRERQGDIEILFRHFIDTLDNRSERHIKNIEAKVFDRLCRYNWPGNVRELQNVAERMMSFSKGDRILETDLPEEILFYKGKHTEPADHEKQDPSVPEGFSIGSMRTTIKQNDEESEKKMIYDALVQCGGNVSEAAGRAGISRSTFYRKMKKYHIE